MNSRLLEAMRHTAESHGVFAEDFADRLNSKWTSMGLLALAAISVLRQYVFKPIQCWVPAEWPKPWEEFVENFCWTQGTYRVALSDPGHPEVQRRGELAINYFQWVPIILLAQALLVMAPHQLWCVASRHLSGRDPHTAVRFACEVERAERPSVKKRLLAYAAWQLDTGLRMAEAGTAAEAGRRRGCSEVMRQSGCILFVVYLASKVAYLLSAIGQVLILQRYLGFASPLFGWHCARDLLFGGAAGQWQRTLVFPRVAFCDVPMRHVGQWNLRSVQCVLACNMLHEKIFIFLWFWFAFCCLASALFTACWLAELLPVSGRRRVVRSHLRLLTAARREPKPGRKAATAGAAASAATKVGFGEVRVAKRLRLDGVFLLQMIADNADCLCAAQVLGGLAKLNRRGGDHLDGQPAAGGGGGGGEVGGEGGGSKQLLPPFGPASKV